MWNQTGFQWRKLPSGLVKIFSKSFHRMSCFPEIRFFLYRKKALVAKDAWSTRPKEGLFSTFPALPSLSFAIVSPHFSIWNVQWILFLLLCSHLYGLPFWQLAQVGFLEGGGDCLLPLVISQVLRFICRPPAPCCASHMGFHLVCSVVSGPSLGKKIGCSGQTSFQTARSPG